MPSTDASAPTLPRLKFLLVNPTPPGVTEPPHPLSVANRRLSETMNQYERAGDVIIDHRVNELYRDSRSMFGAFFLPLIPISSPQEVNLPRAASHAESTTSRGREFWLYKDLPPRGAGEPHLQILGGTPPAGTRGGTPPPECPLIVCIVEPTIEEAIQRWVYGPPDEEVAPADSDDDPLSGLDELLDEANAPEEGGES